MSHYIYTVTSHVRVTPSGCMAGEAKNLHV